MRISILLLFACLSCVSTPEPSKELIAALNDDNLAIRGKIITIAPNDFRYDYYDIHEEDTHYDKLRSLGYQGGGVTWAAIIYGAIRLSDPKISDNIRFDEESDGVAIWCSDSITLTKVGRLVAFLKNNDELLLRSLEAGKIGWLPQ